jgi:hypothetical protein
MSIPAPGEALPIDVNYRSGTGSVEAEDSDKVRNLRVRGNSNRLLVETGPVATNLLPDEVLIDETGAGFTFGSPLKWLAVANDDTSDAVWLRLDTLTGTTIAFNAFKINPQELFDLDSDRIKEGITEFSLITLTGTVASCRVLAGT